MKRVSSAVWKFFERIEQNNRCVAVLCKLCDSQYKYFGNTTNLRVHLINKHPIQWDLSENGTLDESHLCAEDTVAGKSSTPIKRRKYKPRGSADKNVRYSVSVKNEGTEGITPNIEIQRVDVDQHSSDGDDDNTTLNLVRQMHGEQQSDEEWLDDPYHITHIEAYEPKPKRKRKYKTIKREVTSPIDLPGYYIAPKAEKVVYEESSRKDEYSVFGEYVANKLRKVRTPRTRGNLQQLITTILWQAEYGLYDNADTVKRVLMMNVQTEPQHIIEYGSTHPILTEEVIEHREGISDHEHNSGDSTSVLK